MIEIPSIILILAAFATYLEVTLKVFQTLNVVHNKVWWIVPTSLLIQVCHVFVIGVIAIVSVGGFDSAVLLMFLLGIGAGLGSLTGIYIHKRLR